MPFLAVMIWWGLSFILLLWCIIIDFWMLSQISVPGIRILVDSRANPLGHGVNASLWVSGQSACILLRHSEEMWSGSFLALPLSGFGFRVTPVLWNELAALS